MSKWDKVHAILDREVDREVKRVLGRIKAVVGRRGNGNGTAKPISAKRLVTAKIRKAVARAYEKESPIAKRLGKPTKQRQLHGKYLGLTRTLPKEQKAKLSALYKEKGVRAAIKEAKSLRALV